MSARKLGYWRRQLCARPAWVVNAIFHVGSTQSRVRETTFLHQRIFRCEFDARNCFTSNRKCTGARLIHRSWNRFIIINQRPDCTRPSDSVKVDNILIFSYINIRVRKKNSNAHNIYIYNIVKYPYCILWFMRFFQA